VIGNTGQRSNPISLELYRSDLYRLITEEIRSSLIFSTVMAFPIKPALVGTGFDGAEFCQEYASSFPSTCG
jgi:hypothetical protein